MQMMQVIDKIQSTLPGWDSTKCPTARYKKCPTARYIGAIKTNVKPNMIQNDFFLNHRHVLNLPEPVLGKGSKSNQIKQTSLLGFALMACALMNLMA